MKCRIFLNGIQEYDMDISILIDLPRVPSVGEYLMLSKRDHEILEYQLRTHFKAACPFYNCYFDKNAKQILDSNSVDEPHLVDTMPYQVVHDVCTLYDESQEQYITGITLRDFDEANVL